MRARRLAAAAALAIAAPALAYVLPAASVVKKAAEKRAALDVVAVEVTGTLELRGPAAALPAAALAGAPPQAGGAVSLPARLLVKQAGRARLELSVLDAGEATRPFVAVRDEKASGRGGLEAVPAATALVRALAALLAAPPGSDGRALAEALVRRGVKLDDDGLGRFNGRLAFVLGGRLVEARPTPVAFFDKETFLPLRLVAPEGATLLDVRLLDWGSSTGGDWFPRAVEVWQGPELLLRFTTARAVANPRLADGLFEAR